MVVGVVVMLGGAAGGGVVVERGAWVVLAAAGLGAAALAAAALAAVGSSGLRGCPCPAAAAREAANSGAATEEQQRMVDKMRKALAKMQAKANARFEYQPIDGGALRQTSRAGLSHLNVEGQQAQGGRDGDQVQRGTADQLCLCR